jgi:hypothetical protein
MGLRYRRPFCLANAGYSGKVLRVTPELCSEPGLTGSYINVSKKDKGDGDV